MAPPLNARVSLTGRLLQFNCTVLLVLAALLFGLHFTIDSTNPTIQTVGTLALGAVLVGFIIFIIRYYLNQLSRPIDAQTSQLSVESGDSKLTITNPPDKFFERGQMQAVMRAVLLGYDDNLCADGEVIGPAAEGKVRLYSTAEKEKFKSQHQTKVREARAKLATAIITDEPHLSPLLEGTFEPPLSTTQEPESPSGEE
jgi:hypothetical protein